MAGARICSVRQVALQRKSSCSGLVARFAKRHISSSPNVGDFNSLLAEMSIEIYVVLYSFALFHISFVCEMLIPIRPRWGIRLGSDLGSLGTPVFRFDRNVFTTGMGTPHGIGMIS